jgi:polyisoprenoid-binding protein YceI
MLATPARGAQAHFRVDPGATQITAVVAEPLSSIRGDAVASFRAVSGEVDDPDGNPSHARVTIVIDASSYNSGSAMRDRAVTGSVLAAGQFPTITFESTGLKDVKLNSHRSGSAAMTGKLTLRGETRPIEFPVSASLGDDGRLTAEGVATFDYTQFGIRSPSIMGLSAGSVVKVSFRAVAARTAPLTGLLLQRTRISLTSRMVRVDQQRLQLMRSGPKPPVLMKLIPCLTIDPHITARYER